MSTVGSVGLVATQQVVLATSDDPLVLASGEQLQEVTVAFETYGTLNSDASNAVFICHALTGDAHAAGIHAPGDRPGWWDNLIGPGKAVDTDKWFVVCPNLLGGCQGTTGPSSIDPATGDPYGLRFPLLAMSDFVSVHRRLAKHLGVAKWAAVIGGSLGGMQVLEWELKFPQEVASTIIIAASSRLTAQNIAFSAVGRQSIMRDPGFVDGDFQKHGTAPAVGLAVARMLAHITYLSETAFQEKFGREPQFGGTVGGFGIDFAVESYLNYQGEAFLNRFDALSYLYLTRVMDYFDPFAEQGALNLVSQLKPRTLVLSFDTDWRFATEHSRRIVRHLESARVPVTFRDIESVWGHDSFLLAIPDYHNTIRAFLDRTGYELGVGE